MKSRIVWKRSELIQLGMAFDRLKADPTVRLLPDSDLLRSYAQVEALPLERRRQLSTEQALLVISKIDAMRDSQAHTEWSESVNDSADAIVLPTDSLELKAIQHLRKEVNQMETRILIRMETLIKESETRMQDFIRGMFSGLNSNSTPQTVSPKSADTVKERFLVIYPAEASWAHEVPSGVAALRKEGWDIISSTIDANNKCFAQALNFDFIITVDANNTDLCKKRVLKMTFEVGYTKELTSFHCATRQQIMSHVKALILSRAAKAA